MNPINKRPLTSIGYGFVNDKYLAKDQDEYYLRNIQNRNGITYRNLTAYEIEVLVRNNNTSDDWNKLQVSDAFAPELVKNCKFFGLVRIGKLENVSLEYHNVCMPVGLYNSTIISCDFGDNVIINNVNYMSHYIVGNEVMIININELHTTDHSKFGNGILKEGEEEEVRIWLEVCNENGGRKILPFNGMLPGDAYLWSKYRADNVLMNRFQEFTEKKFDKKRGYYGKIGDRCVIKNTSIIKDVWIGTNAYIKGANKLKNLTIDSSDEAPTQIGEGCELVNGIINEGCRIFYGAKAVRFIMASHSQLKYGARLINSYLGNNATISCCEVLNSLIYPAHEQHHNNSFLCAALVMGQSNIAAGATIGSNHNSRAADGELIAGRGFWPGLCVSLKHNSRFASFTLLAKGDYPYELNIPIPFSLVINDEAKNRLTIMPAYWFQYNMYALSRNAHKYVDRDKRTEKIQTIEYDYLAPDSINEVFKSLDLLRKFTATSYYHDQNFSDTDAIAKGDQLLNDASIDFKSFEIVASGFENSNRPVQIIKAKEAYDTFKDLVIYYGITQLLNYTETYKYESLNHAINQLNKLALREQWHNLGGQLIPESAFQNMLDAIKSNKISDWDALHQFYIDNGSKYNELKAAHAFASLLEVLNITGTELTADMLDDLIEKTLVIKEKMVASIYNSRAKDYENPFRMMVYDSPEEMEKVVGSLEDNVFINEQKAELETFRKKISRFTKTLV